MSLVRMEEMQEEVVEVALRLLDIVEAVAGHLQV